jgi:hypothetical protein
MKKIVLGLIIGLALGVAGMWLRHAPAEGAAAAAAPKPEEKPKENPLQVKPEKRAAMGLVLAKPTMATLAPEVTAFGRVLDATPLIALVAEIETARASLAASEKESVRVAKLFSAGANASAQSLELATAAVTRDRTALASARARLVAGWGRALAAKADFGPLLAALEQGRAFARIDVLPGELPVGAPKTARVGALSGGAAAEAEIIGAAPVADVQIQGLSYLVLLGAGAPPAGAALRATLTGAGEAEPAMVVPRSAIVYHQGSAWAFVLGEEDTFERKLVSLGRSVGDGVVVTHGLEDNEQVVTAGAGQLLSAELQAGGAPEEK